MKEIRSMKLAEFKKFMRDNNFTLIMPIKKHMKFKHKSGKMMTVPLHPGDIGKLYIKDANKIIEENKDV